jgi:predicted TIM-barrel enzyme/DNA-binding NtrC family response regulator
MNTYCPTPVLTRRHRAPHPSAATVSSRRFLIGAATGTGMAAQSAVRGGADFLLALNAGRIRCMGEPSIAAMLPLQDSNTLVMGFAPAEILPRVTVPVFFGVASFDPRTDLVGLIEKIRAAGFSGVTNFPTAILIDGAYRRFLEDQGLGFRRELEMLKVAKAHGLATLVYIHTLAEAREAASFGFDIINIDLGWNMGGVMGVDSDLRIEEAAVATNTIARAVRTISPTTRCVVEGGPIVGPQQLEELCKIARVDGYIGGSTIDRLPSENAVEIVTAAFKAIGSAHRHYDKPGRAIDHSRLPLCLWGHSQAAEDARALFTRLAGNDGPLLIVGEPGTGRHEVARALHAASARRRRDLITVPCREAARGRVAIDLFGCVAGARPGIAKTRIGWLQIAHGATILLDDVWSLDPEIQQRLVEAAESSRFWPLGGNSSIDLDVRFISIAGAAVRNGESPRADSRFAQWIGGVTLALPPLRERLEDLPALVEATLSSIQRRTGGARKRLDPATYRLLADYSWPGNLRELAAVLERAVLADRSDILAPRHLPPPLANGTAGRTDASTFGSEKEWILEGLRRNRFRRGRTAEYLGISRKTLYNKMRACGLVPALTRADAGGAGFSRRL